MAEAEKTPKIDPAEVEVLIQPFIGSMNRFSFVFIALIFSIHLFHGQIGQAQSKNPNVELDFIQYGAIRWINCRFRDIIEPTNIKKVVRIKERGFAEGRYGARPDFDKKVQANYNALLTHLINSEEKAGISGRRAEEGTAAELILLMKDDQLYHLEILGSVTITGVVISGAGNQARIDIRGFRSVSLN